jgi:hypothetical protein
MANIEFTPGEIQMLEELLGAETVSFKGILSEMELSPLAKLWNEGYLSQVEAMKLKVQRAREAQERAESHPKELNWRKPVINDRRTMASYLRRG